MFDGCIFKILIENAKKVGFFNLKHIQNQALLCRTYNVGISLTFQKSFICNNSWKMVVICIRHPHFNSFDDQSKRQVVVVAYEASFSRSSYKKRFSGGALLVIAQKRSSLFYAYFKNLPQHQQLHSSYHQQTFKSAPSNNEL